MSTQPSGIELNSNQSIWYFLYRVMPLVVQVDGQDVKAQWGQQFIPVAPGPHRISVAWKMYWVLPVNRGTLDVTVNAGEVVPVRYKVRWIWLFPGKLFRDASPAAPQQPTAASA